MRGNISKQMIERMKKNESLDSEPRGSQPTLKIDQEEKKREKMVVIISGKGRISFSKMEKFQWWIVGKDVEWAKHVNNFSLLSIQLSPI